MLKKFQWLIVRHLITLVDDDVGIFVGIFSINSGPSFV